MADSQRVRVLWPDHLGLARGKYVPARLAARAVNHCVGVFGQGFHRGITRAPGAGFEEGFPDLVATFSPEDVRPGWEDGTSVVVADIERQGQTLAVSARHALRRAIDAWAGLGYRPKVGIELEAFVLEPDGAGGWRPWNTPGAFVYGTGSSVDPTGLLTDLMRMAEHCRLDVESVNSESDVPQFEITLEYGDALDAIDRTFLFRVMAKELAHRDGLLMTFMGRPFSDRAAAACT